MWLVLNFFTLFTPHHSFVYTLYIFPKNFHDNFKRERTLA
jgi:hypothetical protein